MTVVADSWAVLRYLEGSEPAASRVAAALEEDEVVMSWINLGEVFSVVSRRHGDGAAVETIRDLRDVLRAELPTAPIVLDAGRVKADRRLSYADAFAAVTAMSHDAVLLTGDPELLVEGGPWHWEDLRPAG